MGKSPWEANRFSASQEIPSVLWNPKVHYRTQQPATSPYPEAQQSRPCPPSHFLNIYFNIILPSTPGSPTWSLSIRFRHQNPVQISPPPYVPHSPPISFFFTWSPEYFVRGMDNEAPRYAVFFTPLITSPY